jgi:HlyD family secretion protein
LPNRDVERIDKGRGEGQTIASANGCSEATEIEAVAKYAGRVKTILVKEGKFVTAGQAAATMQHRPVSLIAEDADVKGKVRTTAGMTVGRFSFRTSRH